MKKILLFVASLLIASLFTAKAQSKYDSYGPECVKYLSYYSEYYKAKNFDDALVNWRKAVRECPEDATQNLLIHGVSLMKKEYNKNRRNPAVQAAIVDTIIMLYDRRIKYFPKYAVKARNDKAQDMLNFKKNDEAGLYKICGEAIEGNGAETKSMICVFYFSNAVNLYKSGSLDVEQVLADYDKVIALFDEMARQPNADIEAIAKDRATVENLFISSKVASCETLLALFEPRYKENPNDKDLLAKIVKMLQSAEECTDNDLYLNAVESYYRCDPSYRSAYAIYRLHAQKGNVADANKFLQEAIDFDESDDEQDAQYYYELAVFNHKNGNLSKAYTAANRCLSLDHDGDLTGKAYFLCGTIWGSISCKGNEIEARAPYWVAVDYMVKARGADANLAEEANRYIGMYSKYFPQSAEAFMYNLTDGDPYTVSCGGLNARTTVRTQK